MKKYRIQVNGKTYDVEVEEMGSNATAAVQPVKATLNVVPSQPSNPEAPKSQSFAACQVQPAAALDDEVIESPMPGKVLSIEVKMGQTVKEGDVILVLEAMKMENEIVCGRAGNIKEICVSANASVNTGDKLAVVG